MKNSTLKIALAMCLTSSLGYTSVTNAVLDATTWFGTVAQNIQGYDGKLDKLKNKYPMYEHDFPLVDNPNQVAHYLLKLEDYNLFFDDLTVVDRVVIASALAAENNAPAQRGVLTRLEEAKKICETESSLNVKNEAIRKVFKRLEKIRIKIYGVEMSAYMHYVFKKINQHFDSVFKKNEFAYILSSIMTIHTQEIDAKNEALKSVVSKESIVQFLNSLFKEDSMVSIILMKSNLLKEVNLRACGANNFINLLRKMVLVGIGYHNQNPTSSKKRTEDFIKKFIANNINNAKQGDGSINFGQLFDSFGVEYSPDETLTGIRQEISNTMVEALSSLFGNGISQVTQLNNQNESSPSNLKSDDTEENISFMTLLASFGITQEVDNSLDTSKPSGEELTKESPTTKNIEAKTEEKSTKSFFSWGGKKPSDKDDKNSPADNIEEEKTNDSFLTTFRNRFTDNRKPPANNNKRTSNEDD